MSAKKYWLLIASYVFYAAWNPPYTLIILTSTMVDFELARRIGKAETAASKKAFLTLSLVVNLGLLAYFKYSQMVLDSFSNLLKTAGVVYHAPDLDIILPVGISFYTFASLSYTIDVYRGGVKSDWKFLDYALFVSFFPHLVAGPIVRASCLLPQIENPRMPGANQVGWGLVFIVIGLFCKVILADHLFAPVVDELYANPSAEGWFHAWAGIVSFSGQIYYDFSGYSLCAIGLALCFGYDFPDNFRYPYASRGFSDFWRRWHISLSSWLRDYLYISLGGNRINNLRTYLNLMFVMLIGGLWHGASWMFALWGGLHGLFLVAEKAIRSSPNSRCLSLLSQKPLPELATFIVITLAWIPFRAPSLNEASTVFLNLFSFGKTSIAESSQILAIGVMLVTVRWHFALRNTRLETVLAMGFPVLQALLISICLVFLFLFSGGDQRAFLYFQF
ncbi:MAG: MBOAT family O-acyltransferase [Gammaproteobacteria bacterium]